MITLKCQTCNKEILTNNKNKRFCGPKCARSCNIDMSISHNDPYLSSVEMENYIQKYSNFALKNNLQFINTSKFLVSQFNIDYTKMTPIEIVFFIKNKRTEIPKCPTCGNNVNYAGSGKYYEFCSVKCNLKSDQTKNKRTSTVISKYGKTNVFQVKEVIDKIKQVHLFKRQVDNPAKDPAYKEYRKLHPIVFDKEKMIRSRWNNTYSKLNRFSHIITPQFTMEEFHGGGRTKDKLYKWKCSKCEHIFHGYYDDGSVPNCPKCNNQTSIEKFIYDYLTILKIIPEYRNKNILEDLELDFYISEKKLAIETNGNYYHSEKNGKGRTYHLNKLTECNAKGIRLIQIFEDEINNKPAIVKSRIRHILGFTPYKIYGRECEIREIETPLKNKFLNKYHIQGEDKAAIKLGAFYKNRLVAVMTFCKLRKALGQSHKENCWELSRFATISFFSILGISGKLLSYFEKNYNPKVILTYADRRWSEGKMYENLGFTLDHTSPPNYWYMSDYNVREHRFKFRKSELKKLLPSFDSNLSEWENIQLAGYDRIWDCGNLVYLKTLT